MAIRGILIDLGGVLINTKRKSQLDGWAEKMSLETKELLTQIFMSDISLKAMVGENNEQDVWDWLQNKYQLTERQKVDLISSFWEDQILNDELANYIQGLCGKLKTAIFSNSWATIREKLFQKWKIANFFDFIILSAEIHMPKFNPEAFQIAVELMDISPSEIIFIDDSLTALVSANELGFECVQHTKNATTISKIDGLLATRQKSVNDN